jgi:7-cyano-7-deazaguanine synthase
MCCSRTTLPTVRASLHPSTTILLCAGFGVWERNGLVMSADHSEPEVLILLSGGIDSTACVNFFLRMGRTPLALFIDYGQRAAAREWQAVCDVTSFYDVPASRLQWQGMRKGAGLISGRNAFLITAALMEKPTSVSVIAIGIHSGTEYADCSPEFVTRMQTVLSMYEDAHVQLAAPFLDWTKADIIQYCVMNHVPVDLTYSCEQGPHPCGECLSCKDRNLIDVGA